MSIEKEVRFMQTESVAPNPLCRCKHFKRPISKVGRSICKYGFMAPIVIDELNTVISGQYRWDTAMELGLETIAVYQANHLNRAQKKAYRLADHRHELEGDGAGDAVGGELVGV